MRETKYMMSAGLAFSEAADMKKLRREALQGWCLKRFHGAGYELEKGEREDVIYSIDYRLLEPDEKDEYFEMFTIAGWTHVCSEYNMHIFKADKGTVPIYSDAESARDKIRRSAIPVKTLAFYTIGITVIFGLIMLFTSGAIHTISKTIYAFSFVITVPVIMTYLATLFHRFKKIKGDEK